jgi:hypothetical protein
MAVDAAFDRAEFEAQPDFQRWEQFKRWFMWERDNGRGKERGWRQGEHLTAVGRTESGKTTLLRELLPRRDYVVVMATKKQDPSLYEPLIAQGFVLTDKFDPSPDAEHGPKVIFKPALRGPAPEDLLEQREAFREALAGIFAEGGWCVYCDEVRYLSDNLKLRADLEVLWLQGRTLGVTMVCGTQRPVSIPVLAFDAHHLFYWKTADKRDILTMTEYVGVNQDVGRFTIPRLARHEVLYIDTVTDEMARTKVSL